MRCCRPSSFSAASDRAAVADRARSQQIGVGQCGCCQPSSFSAAWRRTVRLLPIELVLSSLGTVLVLSIELNRCKHKTLCTACISRAQLSLATDHSVLGSRSSTVGFFCAEPEGILTMQSYVPHITHPHLHEPRKHQQHELIPINLRTSHNSAVAFAKWPNSPHLQVWSPSSLCRLGANQRGRHREQVHAQRAQMGISQRLSLPVKVVREVTTVLAPHVAARRHPRRDSQNRGAIDTSLFSDPAVR